jgi:hypothetical protein
MSAELAVLKINEGDAGIWIEIVGPTVGQDVAAIPLDPLLNQLPTGIGTQINPTEGGSHWDILGEDLRALDVVGGNYPESILYRINEPDILINCHVSNVLIVCD